MIKSKLVKVLCLFIVLVFSMSIFLTGCGSSTTSSSAASSVAASATTEAPADPITITLNDNSKMNNEYSQKNDLTSVYKKVAPNVTIELEIPKDGTEQRNQLMIRKSANELPDIMVVAKDVEMLLADSLLPLDDLTAVKNNLLNSNATIDGKVLGICEGYNFDLVWYKKSVFTALNLKVPTTWDEFINVATTIKKDGKYIPLLLGAKDQWVCYPFYEAFSFLEANDGDILTKMGNMDAPFAVGTPYYNALAKLQKLNDAEVYGSDPVGMGFDQVKTMIGTKGAMIAMGQWFISDCKKANNDDMSDIGTFFIPQRNTTSDKFNVLSYPATNLCINKDSKNIDACKAFAEWYFSDAWLPGMLGFTMTSSAIKGQKVEFDPAIMEAFNAQPELNLITQNGAGDKNFSEIKNLVKFESQRLGQELIAGKNLDKAITELNTAWKDARVKLSKK